MRHIKIKFSVPMQFLVDISYIIFLISMIFSPSLLALNGYVTTHEPIRYVQARGSHYATDLGRFSGKVVVTGEVSNPTAVVLADLGLYSLINRSDLRIFDVSQRPRVYLAVSPGWLSHFTKKVPDFDWLRGGRVLSLGEGFSGLVPYLLKQGIDATGLDIAYTEREMQNDQELRNYYHLCSEHLVFGDATDLRRWEDKSLRLVLSHRLMHFLTFEQKRLVVRESFRVLESDGIMIHDIPIAQIPYRNGSPNLDLFYVKDSEPTRATLANAIRLIQGALETSKEKYQYCLLVSSQNWTFLYDDSKRDLLTNAMYSSFQVGMPLEKVVAALRQSEQHQKNSGLVSLTLFLVKESL
jgi:ubiquinone/menaquinone biosynthesis C-methylase UbiE